MQNYKKTDDRFDVRASLKKFIALTGSYEISKGILASGGIDEDVVNLVSSEVKEEYTDRCINKLDSLLESSSTSGTAHIYRIAEIRARLQNDGIPDDIIVDVLSDYTKMKNG